MTTLMSTPQVAQRLGMSTRLVRYWCAKGVFPNAFQVGNRWVIPCADVLLREGIHTTETRTSA